MNDAQKKVKQFMDKKIYLIKDDCEHLFAAETQPTETGGLYNGILKHMVPCEIENMERLRDEIMDVLE